VKRTKLATPAALDRDFNFLAGVERALVSRDETESERNKKLEKKTRWAEKLIEQSGVEVRRAPRGMKRAVENSTRVTGYVVFLFFFPFSPWSLLVCTGDG
jgi:hypothetical protein